MNSSYRFSRRCSPPAPQSSPSCWAHSPAGDTPVWAPAESCRTRCCCSWFPVQGRQSAAFSSPLPSDQLCSEIPLPSKTPPPRGKITPIFPVMFLQGQRGDLQPSGASGVYFGRFIGGKKKSKLSYALKVRNSQIFSKYSSSSSEFSSTE